MTQVVPQPFPASLACPLGNGWKTEPREVGLLDFYLKEVSLRFLNWVLKALGSERQPELFPGASDLA